MSAAPPVPARSSSSKGNTAQLPQIPSPLSAAQTGAKKAKKNIKSVFDKAKTSTKWYDSGDTSTEASEGLQGPAAMNMENNTVSFGRRPQKAFCKRCGQENMTTVSHAIGRGTVIAAVVSFFIFPGCTVFLLKSKLCKDVEHKCSVCGKKLGRKKRLPC